MKNRAKYLGAPLAIDGVEPGSLMAVESDHSVERRIIAYAQAEGLIAAPQWYSVRLPSTASGAQQATWNLRADGNEGPLFVLGIDWPTGLTNAGAKLDSLLQIQSGARRLIDGDVSIRSALVTPHERQRGVQAPIIVARADTLTMTAVLPNGGPTWSGTETITIRALSLRSVDGERLGAIADEVAGMVRSEGEWYACGVVLSGDDNPGQRTQNVNVPCIITEALVRHPVTEPGEEAPSGVQWWAGNYQATPDDIIPAAAQYPTPYAATPAGIGVYQTGLAYPMTEGQRVRLRANWPGDEEGRVPVSLCLLGRREGVGNV